MSCNNVCADDKSGMDVLCTVKGNCCAKVRVKVFLCECIKMCKIIAGLKRSARCMYSMNLNGGLKLNNGLLPR